MNRPALLACVFLTAAAGLRAQGTTVDAATIRAQVVDPPLTRAWPKSRSGMVFDAARAAGSTRALAVVEVKVDPDAHISLDNIHFKIGSTELADAGSESQLTSLASALGDVPEGTSFLIEGHTCTIGDDDTNDPLSIARANAVRDFLVGNGVSPDAVRAIGCGAAEAKKDGVPPTAGESKLAPYRKVMIHRIAQ